MGLSSFTNEVGNHTISEMVPESLTYSSQVDPTVRTETSVYGPCSMGYSRKPAPFQGDHHSQYDYYRSVSKVIEHRNYQYHFLRYDYPGENQYYSQSIHRAVPVDFYLDFALGVPGADDAYAKSVNQALDRMSANHAGIGADLGQARQTINELSDMVSRLARALLELKRGNILAAARALANLTGRRINLRSLQKSLADLWLEYSYGIKPFLSDLYELQQVVHSDLRKDLIVRGSSTVRAENSAFNPGFEYGGNILTDKTFSKLSYRTVAIGQVVNPLLYKLNSAGLANPLSIAWELCPWSFVVDWFVPIGETLQCATAGLGLQSLGGQTTIHSNYGNSCSIVPYRHEGFGRLDEVTDGGLLQTQGFGFQRFAHSEFPLPRMRSNPTPYSTPRALNALALVRQLV